MFILLYLCIIVLPHIASGERPVTDIKICLYEDTYIAVSCPTNAILFTKGCHLAARNLLDVHHNAWIAPIYHMKDRKYYWSSVGQFDHFITGLFDLPRDPIQAYDNAKDSIDTDPMACTVNNISHAVLPGIRGKTPADTIWQFYFLEGMVQDFAEGYIHGYECSATEYYKWDYPNLDLSVGRIRVAGTFHQNDDFPCRVNIPTPLTKFR